MNESIKPIGEKPAIPPPAPVEKMGDKGPEKKPAEKKPEDQEDETGDHSTNEGQADTYDQTGKRIPGTKKTGQTIDRQS